MFKTIQANTELKLAIPFEIDGEPVADVHSVEWSVFNEFGQVVGDRRGYSGGWG